MTVTKSAWGWRYMTVGAIACLMLTAVAALNTQNPLFAMALAMVAFVAYVAIYELNSVIRATTKIATIAFAGLGAIGCFIVLMAATNATITGYFSLLPNRPSWWALPIAMALWTLYEIWQRRRPRASRQDGPAGPC